MTPPERRAAARRAEVLRVARRDLVVVGASAGGVEAIKALVSSLPADFRACVLIVLHTPPTGANALAAILSRSTPLTVRPAEAGDVLEPGTILVARSDHHLLVLDGKVALTRGPRENGHRPAIDVLFRSAARARGRRVIGVVLSGTLDDGSAGLVAVTHRGGTAMVQDPQEALQPGMPINAIAAVSPEIVAPVRELAAELVRLAGTEVADDGVGPSEPEDTELAMAGLQAEALQEVDRPGTPAGLACPDCHGTLFTIDEHGYVRYRCRVGHAWSVESLLAESDAALEGALWMALRTLEEKSALARGMAGRAADHGQQMSSARFAEQAAEAKDAAELIRRMLLTGRGSGAVESELVELPAVGPVAAQPEIGSNGA